MAKTPAKSSAKTNDTVWFKITTAITLAVEPEDIGADAQTTEFMRRHTTLITIEDARLECTFRRADGMLLTVLLNLDRDDPDGDKLDVFDGDARRRSQTPPVVPGLGRGAGKSRRPVLTSGRGRYTPSDLLA